MTVGNVKTDNLPVRVGYGRFSVPRERDSSVRIPDPILRCVGFIGEGISQDSERVYGDLYATGFFVAVPCESPYLRGQCAAYFVTAKHVASDLKDRPIYILTNKRGGGVTDNWTSPDNEWWVHPSDHGADVALIQVSENPEADTIHISVLDFGTPERLQRLGIGIGDEIFATGLFTEIPGTTRNLPIVRHGNVAMMPAEQIQTELGFTDAYLVEARSLGGLSGSPVFVRHTLRTEVERADGTREPFFGNGSGMTLLGLMHGHWDIKESEMNKPFFTHDRKHGVNYGVAIVVPASKIYETLYQPELVAMRKHWEQKALRRNVPGMDSAKPDNQDKLFTQSDFEAALKKASKRVPKKD